MWLENGLVPQGTGPGVAPSSGATRWLSAAVAALNRQSARHAGVVGLGGPASGGNGFVANMVRRSHLDLFEYFYPKAIAGTTAASSWIAAVYGDRATTLEGNRSLTVLAGAVPLDSVEVDTKQISVAQERLAWWLEHGRGQNVVSYGLYGGANPRYVKPIRARHRSRVQSVRVLR